MIREMVLKEGRIIIIIITALIFICNTLLYSQEVDLKAWITPTLKSINIPDSFKRSEKTVDCFLEENKFLQPFNCLLIIGYSFNEEFAVLMYGPSRYTVQDSIDFMTIHPVIDVLCMAMGAERPIRVAPSPGIHHRLSMNIHLNWLLRRDKLHEVTPDEFKKYITYYPEEYARCKFNADSAATYNCWPEQEEKPYQGKYTGCQALMLQKKEKGHLILFCFYTEKSKSYLTDFMKKIEGIVWFSD
jgi:hypothetical protein